MDRISSMLCAAVAILAVACSPSSGETEAGEAADAGAEAQIAAAPFESQAFCDFDPSKARKENVDDCRSSGWSAVGNDATSDAAGTCSVSCFGAFQAGMRVGADRGRGVFAFRLREVDGTNKRLAELETDPKSGIPTSRARVVIELENGSLVACLEPRGAPRRCAPAFPTLPVAPGGGPTAVDRTVVVAFPMSIGSEPVDSVVHVWVGCDEHRELRLDDGSFADYDHLLKAEVGCLSQAGGAMKFSWALLDTLP